MKLLGYGDDKENPVALTPWSLIHFTSGGAANEFMSFWVGQGLSVAYEVIDPKTVWQIWTDDVSKNSLLNSVSDHASFTVGQYVLQGTYWKWITILLFFGYTYMRVEL